MRTRYSVLIFFVCAFLYALMNYGGIRSPDGEIVFRASESLESDLTFEIVKDLEDWKGFGVARGNGGKLYSVFGPGQSILCSALIKLAKGIDYNEWRESLRAHLPLSFFQPNGLAMFTTKSRPENIEPHALRFVVSYLYVAVSALAPVVFWLILQKMVLAERVAFFVAILYGFGTMVLAYSGMFLSESLATLFLLASFYFLIGQDPRFQRAADSKSRIGLFGGGIMLGSIDGHPYHGGSVFPFLFLLLRVLL